MNWSNGMRLDRFLSECGFGSRSDVKKLIKLGVVKVSGNEKPRPDLHIDAQTGEVFVNGIRAKYRKYIYLMLNKPKGYISATWDKRLPTVIDLLPEEYLHFKPFPVGRLDIDTEGLLLLTNDGDLSHRLLSPKNYVPKTYIAQLEKKPDSLDIAAFEDGINLGDFVTLPAKLEILSESPPYTAEVTICEGKFHQVKRMFEARNNSVIFLKRIKMKNLCLDERLAPGDIRELTKEELDGLNRL
jgi:16S rRNA pseudouridine516 synthase